MANKGKIVKKIISELDWFIIERIKELRSPKFSQAALSREIGFSDSFIGRIENPATSTVYSLRHINLISKALGINVSELFPKKPLSNDLIKVVIQLGVPTHKKIGNSNFIVISKTPLTDKEIENYNKYTLYRQSKSGQPTKPVKRKPKQKG